ncbi:MAG: hypothetical protein IJE82_02625 [Alphaproteobacteria bacterium]|nr:hypothetical protein [Alphaproteobacteria bacterium]
MPKRIPDEELTPAQLKERERRRLYREKNREKIAAQKREYYLRNIDKYKQRAREQMATMTPEERGVKDAKYREKKREQIRARKRQYYVAHADAYKERAKRYYHSLTAEQKMDLAHARRPSRKAWRERNREHLADKRQQYYAENKERLKTVARQYYEEHVEVLSEKRAVAHTEKVSARQMCPAFRFVEYLRLKNNARFVVVYKPHTNLAHLAANTCTASQQADDKVCPICRNVRIGGDKMGAACAMPRVFEFDDAVQQIRKFAKQIVAENKR